MVRMAGGRGGGRPRPGRVLAGQRTGSVGAVTTTEPGPAIHGVCDERFSVMRDLLTASLAAGTDLGASVAVVLDDELVVDIWGGWADTARTAPWGRDTITNVWSTTKTMTALCALMLVDAGELDLDAAVSR